MKKIILLGDSIRLIGYGETVANRLTGEYEVWQPADNCRYAKYTLRQLFDWKDKIEGADVIHWNNGLWDTCPLFGDGKPFTNEAEYVENMITVAKLLKQMGKRVIFATTTPVHEEFPTNDNGLICRYNQAVVPKLQELGIEINDLHSAVSQDIYRYVGEDQIHLSAEGVDLCAKMVVNAIKGE